ncbi:hypothetical protein C1A50_4819 [Paenibacillus polymyxa]|nr:hypothetical protein C1A50_4819 [Paenibacillus polymyxa]
MLRKAYLFGKSSLCLPYALKLHKKKAGNMNSPLCMQSYDPFIF